MCNSTDATAHTTTRLGRDGLAESGPGAPADLGQLQRRITQLEQELVRMQGELEERTRELEAVRAANRELTRTLNQTSTAR